MADAVDDGILTANPVPRSRRKRAAHVSRSNSDPLTVAEVREFLASVPDQYRELYDVWFRVGWRPSEILAIRFEWIDFHWRTVHLKSGRIARWGGVEAPPKTGEREVDCSYDPAIFGALQRLERRSSRTGRDFVFSDEQSAPLSQEWLHKKIWLPTQAWAATPRSIQHSRYLHHFGAVRRRRPRLGRPCRRNIRADDLRALSEVGAI
jgi:integrase